MKSGFWVIAGRPNVGKSTLLNQIIGERLSIVTPKAQTTRENIRGIFTDPKVGQMIFLDTPGIHTAREGGLNECLMKNVREAFDGANGVWYLIDPGAEIKHEEVVLKTLEAAGLPVMIVFNKTDVNEYEFKLEQRGELETAIRARFAEKNIEVVGRFEISGRYGKNVEELLAATWDRLPEGPFYYPDPDQLSDRPVKFFVAELIREQLFNHLGDEVPYSCAVEIEAFKENMKPIRIEAAIHVERQSQLGMVVGAKGHKIKAIGTDARQHIQKLVDAPVFLGLRVKLNQDWTKSRDQLEKMGFAVSKEARREHHRH